MRENRTSGSTRGRASWRNSRLFLSTLLKEVSYGFEQKGTKETKANPPQPCVGVASFSSFASVKDLASGFEQKGMKETKTNPPQSLFIIVC
jgi:hypothetical protein